MSRFFGAAEHAAFVVPDFDATVNRLIEAGIGPVFTMRRIRVPARFRGERHDPLFSAAFVYTGAMQYEFIAQHDDTPSGYKEFLERKPEGGMHHTAYFAPQGFDAALADAKAQGTEFTIVQEFIDPTGTAYEIYVEPTGSADPLLAQLMIAGPMEPFFKEMERIAASWDGSEPERDALKMIPPGMVPPTEPA
ncbi:VOC family protein [Novosphingobium lentum]|uniref:VOC family protein n=1 Tax=Novosphingobium lentum TaxID=145287 RepID=UPI000836FAA3|nr:VOC family protein [Novosphingobium lentum]